MIRKFHGFFVGLEGVDVVAVLTKILESWEAETGFLERTAESRMNVVIASEPSENRP